MKVLLGDGVNAHDSRLRREQLKSSLSQRIVPRAKVSSAVIPIGEQGTGAPLLCVHGGGAGLPSYKRLAFHLEKQKCYGLQITGATIEDPVVRSVENMATLHLHSLRESPYRGPYILCGHSMGAIVALELAQQLLSVGERVSLLVLIDQPGPDIQLSKLNWMYWQWIAISHLPLRQRWQYVANSIRYRCATCSLLPTAMRRCFYSQKTTSELVTREKISAAEYRRRMTDLTLEALKTYHPRPYHEPMVLFRAESGSPRLHNDSQGGWGKVAEQGVQVIEIPGHHMNIFQPPHVSIFAEKLNRCLQVYK